MSRVCGAGVSATSGETLICTLSFSRQRGRAYPRGEGRWAMALATEQLVGRHEELEVLDGATAALERGDFGAIEIVGEPGIGKTRLLGGTRRACRVADGHISSRYQQIIKGTDRRRCRGGWIVTPQLTEDQSGSGLRKRCHSAGPSCTRFSLGAGPRRRRCSDSTGSWTCLPPRLVERDLADARRGRALGDVNGRTRVPRVRMLPRLSTSSHAGRRRRTPTSRGGEAGLHNP